MAKKNLDYWYDGQVKRYLQQLIRIFSNFQVAENTSSGVNYNTVPCRYADQSRMVAQILRNNSENVIEQLMILFNPNIQLQSNDNPLDWSNVFEVELTDVQWSSRSIPQGVDESLDIATMSFAVPIWISPPAKVKKQTIIQRIVTDMHETNNLEDLGFSTDLADFFSTVPEVAEIVTTPGDYRLQIDGASAVLLDTQYNGIKWEDLIEMQGKLSTTSKLKLNITNDSDNDLDAVIGSVSVNTLDDTKLVFNIDPETLPADTLTNVDKILDPRASYPGDGSLAAAVDGQRYLITETISKTGYPNWDIEAKENDIIQYNGTKWTVVFEASTITDLHYLTNTYTTKQYKWYNESWVSSHEGVYNTGFWRLLL